MSTSPSPSVTRLCRRFLTLFLALAVLGCSPERSPFEKSPTQGALLAETGRVYALVETPTAAKNLQNASRTLGYAPRDTIDLAGLALVMIPVDLPDGVTGPEAIAALETAVPASTVGVNHAYRLQQTSLGVANRRTYANKLMGWPPSGCRARRAIGMIDGGIDTSAPIFAGVDVQARDFADGSTSSRRHGTEVASVLADPTRLSNVSLFSANVIETNETGEDLGSATALVQAIDWMATQNVRLINVSLAGPPNKLLAQAITAANGKGLVMVAAVGNNGPAAAAQFPAAFPSVIAVTALDAKKRIFRKAGRGAHVDYAAPGVDIFVPSESGGRYVSGTSMAAPFVTAYLAAKADGLTPATLEAQDLGSAGRDATFGNGLIQAANGC